MEKKQLPETLEENRVQMDKLEFKKIVVSVLPFLVWFLYIVFFIKEIITDHPNSELVIGCFCGVMGFMILMGGAFLLINKKLAKLGKNQKFLLKELFKNQ